MRRHGFVKGKGRGVTGPGENTEDEGPDAAADLGDFVGVFQELNKEVNDACGTQTGRKNAGGDNDADDVGVAFAHAVKKLLDRVLGVAAGDRKRVNHAHEHRGCDRNLHLRQPQRRAHKEHHGNERRNSVKDVGAFRKFRGGLGLEFAEPFLTVVAVNHADDGHQHNGGNRKTQGHHAVVADEGHHVDTRKLRNEGVVRDARVKVRGHQARSGCSRPKTRAHHDRDDRGTHGRAKTCH